MSSSSHPRQGKSELKKSDFFIFFHFGYSNCSITDNTLTSLPFFCWFFFPFFFLGYTGSLPLYQAASNPLAVFVGAVNRAGELLGGVRERELVPLYKPFLTQNNTKKQGSSVLRCLIIWFISLLCTVSPHQARTLFFFWY